jgi:preprotein translocase SecE subunit
MGEHVAQGTSESIVTRTKDYLVGSVEELKKVQSPSRQETMRMTGGVLLIIVFISLCLFFIDLVWNWLMSKMIG